MNSVFKINVNNDETIECIPLSAKVFQNSYDEKLKNLIKIAVFKYLYLEAINSKIYNFPLQLKLCYTLSASDIDYGISILEISKNDALKNGPKHDSDYFRIPKVKGKHNN